MGESFQLDSPNYPGDLINIEVFGANKNPDNGGKPPK
jgi:hypothetical protein